MHLRICWLRRGGQLTSRQTQAIFGNLVRRNEKAHPDVFNILLQVLDDGRLTDNRGRTVDFRNTIIIMTSNLGSHLIQEKYKNLNVTNQHELREELQPELLQLLLQTIRPEFVNRVDEIIVFTPLMPEVIKEVVRIQFGRLARSLEKNNISISITDSAVNHIATISYDPVFGARPVKRNLQRLVMNDMAKEIISGNITGSSEIEIDFDGEKIVFNNL